MLTATWFGLYLVFGKILTNDLIGDNEFCCPASGENQKSLWRILWKFPKSRLFRIVETNEYQRRHLRHSEPDEYEYQRVREASELEIYKKKPAEELRDGMTQLICTTGSVFDVVADVDGAAVSTECCGVSIFLASPTFITSSVGKMLAARSL